jgi:4-hydroxy-tetrahydrodipicolinate reductase
VSDEAGEHQTNDTDEGVIRVVVAGARGRMGRETVHAVVEAQAMIGDMALVGKVHRGEDLAVVFDKTRPDVLVDFTLPETVYKNAETAIQAGVAPVIGATGLNSEQLSSLDALCRKYHTPALFAPNFAIGAILLMRFAEEAARYFPDVEIIEMHHERKIDAPSGTAYRTAERIGEVIASGERVTGKLPAHEARGMRVGGVPVHSVRLPGFVASQEVLFGGPGQRLSLRHDSMDRASFMPGVLLAVRKVRSLSGLVVGLEHLL